MILIRQVAILYIALGRYRIFWKDFFESAEKFLEQCDKHYFIWTDSAPTEIEYSDRDNVTITHTPKMGWPHDTLLRFERFLQKEKELSKFDYIFFFNANLQFYNPTDLSEIAPAEWHDGLVGGLHPGHPENPDYLNYERRVESTAYIPFGKGRHYLCGALNGGTAVAYLQMCRILSKNIQTDLEKNIIACVDDESHLNAYLVDKNYLLAGRAYLFPEDDVAGIPEGQRKLIKIVSRKKDSPKWGGTKWLRGATDRKISPEHSLTPLLRVLCRIVACFVPNRQTRQKIRRYYGKRNNI
jgi:hypothetical protein